MELLYYVLWVLVLSVFIYLISFGVLMLLMGHRKVSLRAILAGLITTVLVIFFVALAESSVTYENCQVPDINIYAGTFKIPKPIGSCNSAKNAVLLVITATLIVLMVVLAFLLFLELGSPGEEKLDRIETEAMYGTG